MQLRVELLAGDPDTAPAALEKATATIRANLDRQVKKGTLAPGMLAASAFNGALMDSTYNVFFKLKYSRLYDAMLATPLTTGDIVRPPCVVNAANSSPPKTSILPRARKSTRKSLPRMVQAAISVAVCPLRTLYWR